MCNNYNQKIGTPPKKKENWYPLHSLPSPPPWTQYFHYNNSVPSLWFLSIFIWLLQITQIGEIAFVLLWLVYFTYGNVFKVHSHCSLSWFPSSQRLCYILIMYSSASGYFDIFIVWILWTILLWICLYKYLFKCLLWSLLDIYPKGKITGNFLCLISL